MKQSKLVKSLSLIITATVGCIIPGYTSTVFAYDDVCQSNASDEVKKAAGCEGNPDAAANVVIGILNAIITVSGLVAVIYVIYGGVQYMTSAGDSSKAEKARKTILYACIGLIITVLAFAIVNFVIKDIIKAK